MINKWNSYFNSYTRRVFFVCLLVSLITHLGVTYKSVVHHANNFLKSTEKEEEKRIKISFSKKNKNTEKKQIVNDDEKGLKETPVDSKFLGKRDNKSLRQTKASIVDKHKKAGKGSKKAMLSKQAQASKGGGKKGIRKKVKQGPKKKTKRFNMKDLAFKDIGKEVEVKRVVSSAAKGLENGDKGLVGLAHNNDFLEDVKLGDVTSLNTVEYKFYGYYHRIRQKLEQYWGNTLREKAERLYRQGRSIASDSQKITFLVITLNARGEITRIKVKSTSGIKELDDAAIESFNQAGPFPNPPRDMIINGHADIEWGFVVKS